MRRISHGPIPAADAVAVMIDHIDCMVAEGYPFPVIERYIESLTLNEEEKSVGWLLAWSETSSAADRRAVLLGRDLEAA